MSNKNNPDDAINDFINLWQKQFEHLTQSENVISNMFKTNNSAAKAKHEPEQSQHTDLLKSIDDKLCELQLGFKQLDERLANIECEVKKRRSKN